MGSSRLLLPLLLLMGAEACHRGSRTCERSSSGAISAAVQAGARPESIVSTLAPWEPVESTFKGCEIGCGTRGANSLAVVQPGAAVGQLAYCPVSGVVFRIKESSPRRDVNGGTLYFCCEGCARHFSAYREQVLALRGLAPSAN